MDLERLIETFDVIEDWEERYSILIDLGNKLPTLPEELKTQENKVEGCLSQVWMICNQTNDTPPRYEFIADSDSHIVKGLIAVLQAVFSGKTAEEIGNTDIHDIFNQLGLEQHLSPNRRNGFYAMVERIQSLAKEPA
ncbi:cysteine desulfuration protein SufE [bacterium]|nr:cysteine desulfuration protein SufE [bacterium]